MAPPNKEHLQQIEHIRSSDFKASIPVSASYSSLYLSLCDPLRYHSLSHLKKLITRLYVNTVLSRQQLFDERRDGTEQLKLLPPDTLTSFFLSAPKITWRAIRYFEHLLQPNATISKASHMGAVKPSFHWVGNNYFGCCILYYIDTEGELKHKVAISGGSVGKGDERITGIRLRFVGLCNDLVLYSCKNTNTKRKAKLQ